MYFAPPELLSDDRGAAERDEVSADKVAARGGLHRECETQPLPLCGLFAVEERMQRCTDSEREKIEEMEIREKREREGMRRD